MKKVLRAAVEGRLFKSLPKIIMGLLTKIRNEIDRIIGLILRFILKNVLKTNPRKVFFHTQEERYCCNPKYICEQLIKEGYDDIEIVWKTGKYKTDIPYFIKTVKLNTVEYFKEIFSSKIVITNSFLFLGQPIKLKKNQILLETWHGSLGIKRHDASVVKDYWRRKVALKQTGRMTTYAISNSTLENNSFRDSYWPKTPILMYGHARNDIFFPNFEEKRNEIRKNLFEEWEIEEDSKIVMYAPTFRDNHQLDVYTLDLERLLDNLTKKFGGKWYLLLRYHPAIAKSKEVKKQIKELQKLTTGDEERPVILDGTFVDDMQELISVTDIAVTDYSSWIYDFVLMRKPGFIYAPDIEEYNNERGFYYPIETTPFSISTNNDEMEVAIMNFDEKEYLKEVELFLEDKGCIDDGHSSERIVKLIKDLLDGKKPTDAITD